MILKTEYRTPCSPGAHSHALACHLHHGVFVHTCSESHAMKGVLRLWLSIGRYLRPVVVVQLPRVISSVGNCKTIVPQGCRHTRATLSTLLVFQIMRAVASFLCHSELGLLAPPVPHLPAAVFPQYTKGPEPWFTCSGKR